MGEPVAQRSKIDLTTLQVARLSSSDHFEHLFFFVRLHSRVWWRRFTFAVLGISKPPLHRLACHAKQRPHGLLRPAFRVGLAEPAGDLALRLGDLASGGGDLLLSDPTLVNHSDTACLVTPSNAPTASCVHRLASDSRSRRAISRCVLATSRLVAEIYLYAGSY
jgi:hypothetical protein